jgi:hypothetical protein
MRPHKIFTDYMVCTFVDPSKIQEWIKICNLMKTVDNMVCLSFSPTELTIQMVHPSRKGVLDMSFPNTWFSDYDWKDSELYIETESLFTIFSLYSDESRISMMSEKNFLVLKFFHENHIKNFSIPLRNHKERRLQIVKEDGIDFRMDTNYLYTICQDLYKFGDIVYFLLKPEIFHMISFGHEKMVIEIQPSAVEMINEGECEKSFELFYLNLFLKFSILYPKINVKMNTLLHLWIEKEYVINYYVSRVK